MRVTLVCLHYPPEHSGNAVYSGGLAEALAQRGVSVNVVTGLPHYPQWRVYDGYQKGRTELQNGMLSLAVDIPSRRTHSRQPAANGAELWFERTGGAMVSRTSWFSSARRCSRASWLPFQPPSSDTHSPMGPRPLESGRR